jgi:hypothetical protein
VHKGHGSIIGWKLDFTTEPFNNLILFIKFRLDLYKNVTRKNTYQFALTASFNKFILNKHLNEIL